MRTFTDAFAAVEGDALDRAAGYVKPLPVARPSGPVHPAWCPFRPHFERIVGILRRRGATYDLAQEAVQDALVTVLEREPDLCEKEPDRVLGSVFRYAEKRAMRLRSDRPDVDSLDQILDMKHKPGTGEAQERLDLARPVIAYTKAGVDEEARHAPPPAKRESWTRLQAIGAAQRFRDLHGRAPTVREFYCDPTLPNPYHLTKLGFATVNDLLLEAGVPVENWSGRSKWELQEAAEACYRFRRRHGFWPNEADSRRLPIGTLPSGKAMERIFGGASDEAVQVGCEAVLGPIDRRQETTA